MQPATVQGVCPGRLLWSSFFILVEGCAGMRILSMAWFPLSQSAINSIFFASPILAHSIRARGKRENAYADAHPTYRGSHEFGLAGIKLSRIPSCLVSFTRQRSFLAIAES